MFSLIKGLSLGAGAMYFLDPAAGEKRRNELVDQISGLGQQFQGLLGESSRDLQDRAKGLVGEATEHVDLPFDAAALNPAGWPPAAKVVGGAIGVMVGMKMLKHMPLATLAIGAVGLGLFVQKNSGQGGEMNWKGFGGGLSDVGGYGSGGMHSPAFTRTNYSQPTRPTTETPMTAPPIGTTGDAPKV